MRVAFVIGFGLFLGAVASCASRTAPERVGDLEVHVYENIVKNPQGAVSSGRVEFMVSDYRDDENSGFIWKVSRKEIVPMYDGLTHPRGLSWDWRRGRLFVADHHAVKSFRTKKERNQEPVVFSLPFEEGSSHYLSDVSFSIMKHELYACDPLGGRVFRVNPKKMEVEQVLSRTDFERLGFGGPVSLNVSVDGKRLYVTTDTTGWPEAESAAILVYGMRDQSLEVVAQSSDFQALSGLELFSNLFFVADSKSGKVWTVPVKDSTQIEPFSHLNQFERITAFTVDDNHALIGGVRSESDAEDISLVRVHFPLRK